MQDPQDEKVSYPIQVKTVMLPYIHPKLDINHLKENLKLYSHSDIQKIISLNLPDGRIKRKTLEDLGIKSAPWDIIKSNDRYYAVYKGKEKALGGGVSGFTKLAQDLTSGDFFVLKIIAKTMKHRLYPEAFTDETKALQSADQLLLAYDRQVPSKQKDQYEILMKLAPGITLDLLSDRDQATIRWLDVCIAIMKSLESLHQRLIIHDDIHMSNVIFHPALQGITFIDFGKSSFIVPTPGPHFYEIDTVGILLARLLRLVSLQRGKGYVLLSPDEDNPLSKIPSEQTRAKLLEVLACMINDKLIKEQEVIEWLIDIKNELDSSERKIKVGYLNLQDYLRANESTRATMIAALKAKDEVFLVDVNPTPLKKYLEIQQELEKAGLIIMPGIVQSQMQSITATISEHIKQRNPNTRDYIWEYSYIAQGIEQGISITETGLDEKARTESRTVQDEETSPKLGFK